MKRAAWMIALGTLLLGSGVAASAEATAPDPAIYDAYYDDYYGEFHDGYWGTDGTFWYTDGAHRWKQDTKGHFRKDAADKFHLVHGSGQPRQH